MIAATPALQKLHPKDMPSFSSLETQSHTHIYTYSNSISHCIAAINALLNILRQKVGASLVKKRTSSQVKVDAPTFVSKKVLTTARARIKRGTCCHAPKGAFQRCVCQSFFCSYCCHGSKVWDMKLFGWELTKDRCYFPKENIMWFRYFLRIDGLVISRPCPWDPSF